MQEGIGRDAIPAGSRVDHSSDAAIDRSLGTTKAAAFHDYIQLARPLWIVVRKQAAAFGATRRDTDPEVVHALRVALRRLKALQWAYRPRIDAPVFETERRATQKLLKTAGSVRDWDVALSLAEDWVPRLGKTRTVLSTVRADAAIFGVSDLTEQLARVDTLPAGSIGSAHDLSSARAALISRPIDLAFLATRLGTARKQMRKRIKQAVRGGADHYAGMHEVRKAGKRVRDVHAVIVDFTHMRLTRFNEVSTPVEANAASHGESAVATTARGGVFGHAAEMPVRKRAKKALKKRAKREDKWAGRLLTKRQRKHLQRVQSRFGALNDVVHSAALLRRTAERSGRFAHTLGVDRFIRTLDAVACRYRRKALAAL